MTLVVWLKRRPADYLLKAKDVQEDQRRNARARPEVGVRSPIDEYFLRERQMSEGDTRHREIPVDPAILQELPENRGLWHRTSDEGEDQTAKAQLRAEATSILSTLVDTKLTRRQKEIVILYFHEDKTQAEIAEILGISQQVVSKQLFGVMRAGKKIGGAIKRLKRALEENNITFD